MTQKYNELEEFLIKIRPIISVWPLQRMSGFGGNNPITKFFQHVDSDGAKGRRFADGHYWKIAKCLCEHLGTVHTKSFDITFECNGGVISVRENMLPPELFLQFTEHQKNEFAKFLNN